MKKVLGKINITVLLMGMILLCGGCSKGRTVSAPSTNIENVENITFPEAGWVTAL
ncbi:hypothetical protein SAMN04487770_10683 [Butyrivibrio sp. ob235]|uniref:hypothetical protein n=1 Tax=Butyrivibrio sp. ob235 TaxID=1761780 RepID=UPI0008AB5AB0|nr:hypothetical protein [Butyrivibrio sp. ob235]SEL13472.1 hypothetical protein SAMN04487770_10683 [Butyrivibrio sp. ob235]